MTLATDSSAAEVVPGPPSDEVTDLRQRLAILQQKRADDKTRIKELEKFKAQFMQVKEMGLLAHHYSVDDHYRVGCDDHYRAL